MATSDTKEVATCSPLFVVKLIVRGQDAINASLQRSQEDEERRSRELEDRLQRESALHAEAMEDMKQALTHEIRQNAEKLATTEAELLATQQRCEELTRNKVNWWLSDLSVLPAPCKKTFHVYTQLHPRLNNRYD